jgi:response regulator of citrate/malate metabolism
MIWEYFENMYSDNVANQEEIDQFLNAHDPTKSNQEDIKNLQRYIKSNDVETVIKNLQK